MARWIALTRDVSPSLPQCELTHLRREPIDVSRAIAQHEAYCRLMASLGAEVIRLPADPARPDSCFVEDTAVVLDEVAVMARPGALSRRPEVEPVAAALSPYRPIARILEPARLDGGDVLQIGRRVFVGLSSRTDEAGARALQALVAEHGYVVVPVEMRGCLHLKSAVTQIAEGAVLMNAEWMDTTPFDGLEHVGVDPHEPGAANVLRLGPAVVVAEGFPRTRDRLLARGLDVHAVDVSEFLKAEAGVTCKSLLFRPPPQLSTVDG